MRWNSDNKQAFLACLNTLEQDEIVQQLKDFAHHGQGTTRYDHSLLVAYLSFLICRKCKLNYTAAARAGMLHDLFHAEWEGSEHGALSRWRTHPTEALRNAQRYNLSALESDIIAKHMWPVTPERPSYRESYVVTLADKIAAVLETTHLNVLFGVQRNLASFA